MRRSPPIPWKLIFIAFVRKLNRIPLTPGSSSLKGVDTAWIRKGSKIIPKRVPERVNQVSGQKPNMAPKAHR
jgi:hypothetical protein